MASVQSQYDLLDAAKADRSSNDFSKVTFLEKGKYTIHNTAFKSRNRAGRTQVRDSLSLIPRFLNCLLDLRSSSFEPKMVKRSKEELGCLKEKTPSQWSTTL